MAALHVEATPPGRSHTTSVETPLVDRALPAGRGPGSSGGWSGAVWGMTVARLPSGSPIVVSCGNDGVLCRWDDTGARLGARSSSALAR